MSADVAESPWRASREPTAAALRYTARRSSACQRVCVRHCLRAEAAQDFCAECIADYAVPETWTIGTEVLPRNINGKLMTHVLRQSLVLAPN